MRRNVCEYKYDCSSISGNVCCALRINMKRNMSYDVSFTQLSRLYTDLSLQKEAFRLQHFDVIQTSLL